MYAYFIFNTGILVRVVVDEEGDYESADFSDAASAQLHNPDLADHARGYRADADRLAGGRLAPAPG